LGALRPLTKTPDPMKKIISLLLFLLVITRMHAEKSLQQTGYEIKGRVVDQQHRPFPFATVGIRRAGDAKAVQATRTDTGGYFKILATEKGDYILSVSAIGMDSLSVALTLADVKVVELPELMLIAVSKQLKEVTIAASKPLLERKIDRIIFNVDQSIAAKGMDLTQALALTPMLRVTDDGVSIVGKSGVAIMINDRILNLSGADLINYLKSLRSDDIERIEVITTPPAKYEAQGNSGLINLVIKKNPNFGWSGSYSSSYQQATYGGYANNLNLNYQSPKLSTSLKLRQYDRDTHPTEEIDILGTQSILSNDSRKDMVYGFGANLSADYKASDKADIGFIYDIGKLNYDMDILNRTIYQYNNHIDSILTTLSNHKNPALSQTLNLYYDQKLGKSGEKLSTGFNYFSTTPTNDVNFTTTSDQSPIAQVVRNTSNLDYKISAVQTDLTLPYKALDVETGLKFTNFDNNSDVGYFNLLQNNYVEDPTKSNVFDYNEQNFAAYVSAQKDFSKKWSAKAGLRYEYSIIDGHSRDSTDGSHFRYGKLFPSFYLAYKPDQDNTYSFSYSRRINRPGFQALNPFRWYSNPYSYYTGTPTLQPSFNDNFDLTYLYKGIFSFDLYVQKLSNGFGRIVTVDSTLKIVNYQNYLTQYNSGAEVTLAVNPFPWWENREFLSFNISNSSSAIPQVLTENGSAFYYSTYNTFTLSKIMHFYANFYESLPATTGNVHSRSFYNLSSGLKLALANNNLQLNAGVDDILHSAVSKGYISYETFTQTFNNYYDARKLTVSITYIFGKSKVQGDKKQVNFKETQRAN